MQDTGGKVIHIGKNTRSNILAKGVSMDGGINCYRGLVKFTASAENAESTVACDSLLLDNTSEAVAIPYNDVENPTAKLHYEASVLKVDEEKLFYLQSRGFSEDDAKLLLVQGFCDRVIKEIDVEYSVELTRLIKLILEDAKVIGKEK